MLYRGQAYGAPVGGWWTSVRRDAESFALARGGSSWMILAIDEDDPKFLRQHLQFEGVGEERADWYYISPEDLRRAWRGVRIVGGNINL